MSFDFFSKIGTSHTICQDYSLSGRKGSEDDGIEYAIVSDGCSGKPSEVPGYPFTDYGSRFLVRAAEMNMPTHPDYRDRFPIVKVVTEAKAMARVAYLPPESIDATMILAIRDKDVLRIFRYGDGVVAIKFKDGHIWHQSIKYNDNKPLYPSYLTSERRFSEAVKEIQTMYMITGSIGSPSNIPSTWELFSGTEQYQKVQHPEIWNKWGDVDTVLIFSDGVESFHQRGRQIPLEDVLEQIFSFKSYAGRFLTRRCRRFFDKFCVENGWKNIDDFSVAGLHNDGCNP